MKYVDLTAKLYEGLETFPSHPKITIINFSTNAWSRARYVPPCDGFNSKLFMMSDHGGTHVDSPRHYFPDRPSIDELPLDHFMGEAVFIDVSHKAVDEPVTPQMVEEAMIAQKVEIRPGDMVLFRCWPKEWLAEGFHECKALAPEMGAWLVEKKIKLAGLDLANIDMNENMSRTVHMALLPRNILVIENLTNFESLTKNRFVFMALPLKIEGLTGSPIRAVAIEEW